MSKEKRTLATIMITVTVVMGLIAQNINLVCLGWFMLFYVMLKDDF